MIQTLGKFFGKLWRIWYYVLAGLFVLPMFPILYVFSLKDSWFPAFGLCGKIWSRLVVHGMGFLISVRREASIPKGQYVVCPNHSSYLDIPLLLSVIRFPVKFIGKAELGRIPLFGTLYRRTAVLVDRASVSSRKQALQSAMDVVEAGHSMCFFPEGKIPRNPDLVLDQFKNGAFIVAIQKQIPIIPVTFVNVKRHYPSRSHKGFPGLLKVVVHAPVPTAGLGMDQLDELKTRVREQILNALKDGSK